VGSAGAACRLREAGVDSVPWSDGRVVGQKAQRPRRELHQHLRHRLLKPDRVVRRYDGGAVASHDLLPGCFVEGWIEILLLH
jgi:hypothetical protein